MRPVFLLLLFALLAAGCRTSGKPVTTPAPVGGVIPPPSTTRGEFMIEAGKLDTWNAVGQIAVRTPGVSYDGRAQMMDLYALRYRGESFMVLTKGVLASETVQRLTTRVTATTAAGKPIDSDAAADLLALLQRELPGEIASVRARQAAQQQAKAKEGRKRKNVAEGSPQPRPIRRHHGANSQRQAAT